MNTKHTPGPWRLTDEGLIDAKNCAPYIAKVFFYTYGDHGQLMDEGDANARLIAAAPELLAALQLIVSDPECRESLTSSQHSAAYAAIAKATGSAE